MSNTSPQQGMEPVRELRQVLRDLLVRITEPDFRLHTYEHPVEEMPFLVGNHTLGCLGCRIEAVLEDTPA